MLEAFRSLEIIMEWTNETWCYGICLPGEEYIATGYGADREECWQKAIRAKNYIQKHGLQTQPYGS